MATRDIPAPHLKDLLLTSSLEKNPSSSSNSAPLPPPRVAIVGGSMAGCCAAIALSSIGCPVTIFERTPGKLPSQGAGLVIQPDMAVFLEHFKVVDSVESISFKSSGRQYVDRQENAISGDENPQLFTAWDALHTVLQAAVPKESYHSDSCIRKIDLVTSENGPENGPSGGIAALDLSSKASTSAAVELADGQEIASDLIIGADGVGSKVRRTFLPKESSSYQGYVAWRGVLEESDTPKHVLEFLKQKFTVYRGDCFHILCYLIPGANGEIVPGQRRVNWVWYCNWEESGLSDILTDIHGHSHGYSVPRGLLKPEIAEGRREFAREVLPEALADMVCATKDIFVQAIHDYLASQMVFNSRVVLVGDAGCILRPHTAAGTTKAAINAWALARCLEESGFNLDAALERYNAAMMEVGKHLVDVGVRIGTASQFPEQGGGGNGDDGWENIRHKGDTSLRE